jgi:hypothetical protein
MADDGYGIPKDPGAEIKAETPVDADEEEDVRPHIDEVLKLLSLIEHDLYL